MLVAIRDNGTVAPITAQTHESEFQLWSQNFDPGDFKKICDALNGYIDNQGRGEIATSSWIPGEDWTNTPYQAIYESVGESWEIARFFFGLIVWHVFLNRPETWSFGRYPRNPGDTIGMTYFKIEIPALR